VKKTFADWVIFPAIKYIKGKVYKTKVNWNPKFQFAYIKQKTGKPIAHLLPLMEYWDSGIPPAFIRTESGFGLPTLAWRFTAVIPSQVYKSAKGCTEK
jgi:hypothetical protein